ncbi:hypothetical protein [Flavobacterium aestuarii]|uniref:hypothetical protein n=1 Tax=Flavobacterium aestuarii TaxID=3149227 RepID=UPI0032B41663
MDFYSFIQIIVTTAFAVSAMTLFSYAISASYKELYKEPVLLTFVLIKLNLELSLNTKKKAAWLIHYLIGLIFVLIYHFLWTKAILELSFLSGLLLGSLSGIVGIFGWLLIFKLAKYKPHIDFKGYYLQLFFAHIIFGVTAAAVYWIFAALYLAVASMINS